MCQVSGKRGLSTSLGEVPFKPEEYTDLLLPPFPSLPDDFELPGDVEKRVETKAKYEADVKLDNLPLPNLQDPVALAALEPLVTRARRTSRPPPAIRNKLSRRWITFTSSGRLHEGYVYWAGSIYCNWEKLNTAQITGGLLC